MKRLLVLFMAISCVNANCLPIYAENDADLSTLSIPDLVQGLDTASETDNFVSRQARRKNVEALLREIIARGGTEAGKTEAERLLSELLERRRSTLKAAEEKLETLPTSSDDWMNQYAHVDRLQKNLDVLTALRRIQNKADPLVVDVALTADLEAWSQNHRLARWLGMRDGTPEPLDALEANLAAANKEVEKARSVLAVMNEEANPAAWKKQAEVVDKLEGEARLAKQLVEFQREFEERAPRACEIPVRGPVRANTRLLPAFVVALRSADVDRTPVWLKKGGDYRSGREARWRFEVKDADGHILPVRRMEGMMGGGIFQEGPLKFGETWKTALPMADFVDIPIPGEYTVTILYHNNVTIADVRELDEFDHLILFRSAPFKLIVEKGPRRLIKSNQAARARAISLVAELPSEGIVRIVYGKYDESFHQFIDPDTAAATLLTMAQEAVPALLDAINDSKVSRHRKAWILSILYTILCERDLNPTEFAGALPDHQWQSSPSCCGSCSGCRITGRGQQALIDKWNELRRDYLEIRETD